MRMLLINGVVCLCLLSLVALTVYLEVDVCFTILPMRFGIGPKFVGLQLFHIAMIVSLAGVSIAWYRQDRYRNQVYIMLVFFAALVIVLLSLLLVYQNPFPEQ